MARKTTFSAGKRRREAAKRDKRARKEERKEERKRQAELGVSEPQMDGFAPGGEEVLEAQPEAETESEPREP
jgi:hypothetical protein